VRFAIVALVTALLATGCSAAAAAPAPKAAVVVDEAPLLASEGGVLRPIDNGGRVAMKGGYAEVRFTPSPQSMDPQLQVSLFDPAGQPRTADVSVEWESLDMDHGTDSATGSLHEGCYRMRLSFAMPGSWRLKVHVTGSGAEEIVTLVLPWVGL
jgi:hypothetical protein